MGHISSYFSTNNLVLTCLWKSLHLFFFFLISVEARSFVNSYRKSADPARSEFHRTNCWNSFNINLNFYLFGGFLLEKEEETN